MAIRATASAAIKATKAGRYLALVKDVVTIGTQAPMEAGKAREYKFIMVYQLFSLRGVPLADDRGNPVTFPEYYSLKFSKYKGKNPAKFRVHTEAILDRTYTEAEGQKGEEPEALLEKQCQLKMIVNEDGKNKIESVMPMEEGDPVLKLTADSIYYEVDPSKPIPEEIPNYMKTLIRQSDEFAAYAKAAGNAGGGADDDDDAPPAASTSLGIAADRPAARLADRALAPVMVGPGGETIPF